MPAAQRFWLLSSINTSGFNPFRGPGSGLQRCRGESLARGNLVVKPVLIFAVNTQGLHESDSF